jgi:hypothetical protein
MDAVNFTAYGTRWRAVPVTADDLTREHVPALTSTGVLFTSADGEMRFLPLDADAVPTFEFLKTKKNTELGALVELAKPIAR